MVERHTDERRLCLRVFGGIHFSLVQLVSESKMGPHCSPYLNLTKFPVCLVSVNTLHEYKTDFPSPPIQPLQTVSMPTCSSALQLDSV